MEKISASVKSLLTLSDRESLEITGVTAVKGFDSEYAMIGMSEGDLVVWGSNMQIDDLSQGTGKISIRGRIDSLSFEKVKDKRKRGLFG